MDFWGEREEWLAFVESEMLDRSELEREILTAGFGLDGKIARDASEIQRIFYRRGVTSDQAIKLMTEITQKWRYRNHDAPEQLPSDYSRTPSKSDRSRFQMLDKLGVELAEQVTGLPTQFVSSDWHRQTWRSNGFESEIEAEDSGGHIPIHIAVEPSFEVAVSIIDFTGGAALTVFDVEFDEEDNAFRVVGKAVDAERGETQILVAPPDPDDDDLII